MNFMNKKKTMNKSIFKIEFGAVRQTGKIRRNHQKNPYESVDDRSLFRLCLENKRKRASRTLKGQIH